MTDIQNLKRALETDSAFEREFTPEVCAALIQRIEELEKDAGRYRYLRGDRDPHDGGPFVSIYRHAFTQWTGAHCDDQVDAAIAAQSTKEQG